MCDVAWNARCQHRLRASGQIPHAGLGERVGETHRVHQALVCDDAVDRAPRIVGVGRCVHRQTVGDRFGDIRHRHHASVASLQSATVATAVIDQVDPRLFRPAALGVVEGARYEAREVRLVAHVGSLVRAHVADVAVGDRVLVGMQPHLVILTLRQAQGKDEGRSKGRRVFDRELDARVAGARSQRL